MSASANVSFDASPATAAPPSADGGMLGANLIGLAIVRGIDDEIARDACRH